MEIVERFREKGAISPEKALSAQELGLPPYFELAMRRRLGRLGIFVEVDGKYYLDESRLSQLEEQYFKRGHRSDQAGWKRNKMRGWPRYLRLILMLPIGLIVSLAIFCLLYLSGVRLFPGEFLIIVTIATIIMTVVRIIFWRSRRRYWSGRW